MGSPKLSQGPQQPDGFEEPWGFRRWSIKSYLWPICEPAEHAWQARGRSDSQKGMVIFILAALSICNVVYLRQKQRREQNIVMLQGRGVGWEERNSQLIQIRKEKKHS